MILDEIGGRLSSQGLASSSGAGGWLLALGMLPDSTQLPNKIVALRETPGSPPEDFTEIDKPAFQVLVRGDSLKAASTAYQDARNQAEAIKLDLHTLAPITLSGRHYIGIWAQQDPFLLETDAQLRPVFVTNYLAYRSRT